MGDRIAVSWMSRTGNACKGLVLLPPHFNHEAKYPLIVFVYPTPAIPYANTFGFWGGFFNMQLFASRGYAVFFPDIDVLSHPEPMKEIADIVLPGIDRVISMGIADRNRIGVYGHSGGGYATLSLIVQSSIFRAAVDSAGPADFLSIYGIPLDDSGQSFGITYTEQQMGMKLDPWHDRDHYMRNSPWFELDKATAATLIIVGTDDHTIIPQTDQTFVALRRLGKRSEYARYQGEVQAEEWWSYAHKLDAENRIINWFRRYLAEAATTHP